MNERAIQDQRLISLAGRLDPRLLRDDQRKELSKALRRETDRKRRRERAAREFYRKFRSLFL